MTQLPQNIAEAKARADAAGGVQAYPYNPTLDSKGMLMTIGLDKLRHVADLSIAKWLYELLWHAQALERDPRYQSEKERERKRKRAEELDWLESVAVTSMNGGFGRFIQQKCVETIGTEGGSFRDDEVSLRLWLHTIRRLDWRSGADANRRQAR